jgi:predicted nuclease of restriction endonuclease-like RecB superfamily
MLTSDLLRVRVNKPAKKSEAKTARVEPEYLDVESPDALARAAELIEIFERHRDDAEQNTRGAVDEALDDVIGHGTDFVIWRGLAKLLFDRTEFEVVSSVEPGEIRRAVFAASAELGPVTSGEVRRRVLEQAGVALELAPEEVEESLYADLDARKKLTSFKAIEPQALLHRYNLALAQAVLYKATKLVVELGELDSNRLRYLFQMLKFRRLMHRCERIDSGYRLEIDGPASLFSKSRKYGLQMAMFLPALLICERWAMRAELDWSGSKSSGRGSRYEMVLSHKDGLVSHLRATGQWVAEEERYFEDRFAEAETDWELERQGSIVELAGNQVIIPDYRLRHPDGREVFLEVVGFWRLGYLQRRIDLLVESADVPLVLVVSERLKTGREKLKNMPPEVVFFKGVILVNKVLAAVESASE